MQKRNETFSAQEWFRSGDNLLLRCSKNSPYHPSQQHKKPRSAASRRRSKSVYKFRIGTLPGWDTFGEMNYWSENRQREHSPPQHTGAVCAGCLTAWPRVKDYLRDPSPFTGFGASGQLRSAQVDLAPIFFVSHHLVLMMMMMLMMKMILLALSLNIHILLPQRKIHVRMSLSRTRQKEGKTQDWTWGAIDWKESIKLWFAGFSDQIPVAPFNEFQSQLVFLVCFSSGRVKESIIPLIWGHSARQSATGTAKPKRWKVNHENISKTELPLVDAGKNSAPATRFICILLSFGWSFQSSAKVKWVKTQKKVS